MKLKVGELYTCPNSGLIVEIAKIRYVDPNGVYCKVGIRYYVNPSQRLFTYERSVKLIYKNIQHWYRYQEAA